MDKCVLWSGSRVKGYGVLWEARKRLLAHRVAYEKANGSIPAGLCVCHACDNPACVNVAHLFLGTRGDNNRDRHSKGRDAKGDRHFSRQSPGRIARGQRNGTKTHPERVARGERSARSKLTEDQVRRMRAMRSDGALLREVAAAFQITIANAWEVVNRKTWRHV